jgi:NADP-dependent 3-hydroxy acid dehydrogenase YdfG
MKVWLITESSRGLGRAIAQTAPAAGDHVFATACKTDALKDLIERFGDGVATFPLDVADANAVGEPLRWRLRTSAGSTCR